MSSYKASPLLCSIIALYLSANWLSYYFTTILIRYELHNLCFDIQKVIFCIEQEECCKTSNRKKIIIEIFMQNKINYTLICIYL